MQKCLKQIEWYKYTVDKKAIMTLVCGQCDKVMLSELALGTTNEADHNAGNFVNFLCQLQVICFQNNDGGLSYTPYKGVITLKSLHDFTNPDLRILVDIKKRSRLSTVP